MSTVNPDIITFKEIYENFTTRALDGDSLNNILNEKEQISLEEMGTICNKTKSFNEMNKDDYCKLLSCKDLCFGQEMRENVQKALNMKNNHNGDEEVQHHVDAFLFTQLFPLYTAATQPGQAGFSSKHSKVPTCTLIVNKKLPEDKDNLSIHIILPIMHLKSPLALQQIAVLLTLLRRYKKAKVHLYMIALKVTDEIVRTHFSEEINLTYKDLEHYLNLDFLSSFFHLLFLAEDAKDIKLLDVLLACHHELLYDNHGYRSGEGYFDPIFKQRGGQELLWVATGNKSLGEEYSKFFIQIFHHLFQQRTWNPQDHILFITMLPLAVVLNTYLQVIREQRIYREKLTCCTNCTKKDGCCLKNVYIVGYLPATWGGPIPYFITPQSIKINRSIINKKQHSTGNKGRHQIDEDQCIRVRYLKRAIYEAVCCINNNLWKGISEEAPYPTIIARVSEIFESATREILEIIRLI
jgi:hypothetical protein